MWWPGSAGSPSGKPVRWRPGGCTSTCGPPPSSIVARRPQRAPPPVGAEIADLGEDSGHRVVRVVRKGARKAKIPLTPATVAALEAYLAARAQRAGAADWRQLTGPLLATVAGGRLRQGHLWELVRRLVRTAGIGAWEQLSPHSLRHSAITFALDAGASLRDVQDYADPAGLFVARRARCSIRAAGLARMLPAAVVSSSLPLVPAAESGMPCLCSLPPGRSRIRRSPRRSRRCTAGGRRRGRWRCRSVTGWASGWVMRSSRPRSGTGAARGGPRRGWRW